MVVHTWFRNRYIVSKMLKVFTYKLRSRRGYGSMAKTKHCWSVEATGCLQKVSKIRYLPFFAHCTLARAFNRNNNEPIIFINYKRSVAAWAIFKFSFFLGIQIVRLLSRLLCQGTSRARNNFQVIQRLRQTFPSFLMQPRSSSCFYHYINQSY